MTFHFSETEAEILSELAKVTELSLGSWESEPEGIVPSMWVLNHHPVLSMWIFEAIQILDNYLSHAHRKNSQSLSQMSTAAEGEVLKPGDQSRSLTHVAGTHLLEPSPLPLTRHIGRKMESAARAGD